MEINSTIVPVKSETIKLWVPPHFGFGWESDVLISIGGTTGGNCVISQVSYVPQKDPMEKKNDPLWTTGSRSR